MTGTALKIIAMVTMTVDHIGFIFFPEMIWLHAIGRIAFPIFAFTAAEGIRFTHNRKRYIGRLLLCGLISEIPFDLMCNGTAFSLNSQNVCFTLAAGITCVYLLENRQPANIAAAICILVAVNLLGTDYGAFGAISIITMYYCITGGSPFAGAFAGCLLLTVVFGVFEAPCLLALLPLALYNGRRGTNIKYLFYTFYPLHMLILWAVFAT